MNTMEAPECILDLPLELLVMCFAHLDVRDIPSVSRSCKYLNEVAHDNSLWKHLYETKWHIEDDSFQDWEKQYYLRKDKWRNAIEIFKHSPSDAIDLLIKEKKIKGEPSEIASFLATPGMDRAAVGIFLTTAENVTNGVFQAFLATLQFHNMEIDVAFRSFLATVVLPPSTKRLEYVIAMFADRYYECNPNGPFENSGYVYSLAYSMILLNTDLHNECVKTKMTCKEFIAVARQTFVGSTLTDAYFEKVYQNIKECPILIIQAKYTTQTQTTGFWRTFKSKVSTLWD
mmetsp:Transcript_15003/g.20990  ORF Transcript_15003/g.20990 Transcript_15003/m.20990 type:complete len:287 (-) Transcript_15003:43-903(-)